MDKRIRIGVVGLGKIAQAEHLPAIARNPDFELAFVVDRAVRLDLAVPSFSSMADALQANIGFDAIAICTSPQVRFELCQTLIEHGAAILLEKPAAANFELAQQIEQQANQLDTCLFASWHSRFAPLVAEAQRWAENRAVKSGRITWREDAQKWHPGQDWIWREGGFGVFDPGMNALSLLTLILPCPWTVAEAKIFIPSNVETPNRAAFNLLSESIHIETHFEFHDQEEDVWTLQLLAEDGGDMELLDGGKRLRINGSEVGTECSLGEYDRVYQQFSSLIARHGSDFDSSPLKIIDEVFKTADTYSCGPVQI